MGRRSSHRADLAPDPEAVRLKLESTAGKAMVSMQAGRHGRFWFTSDDLSIERPSWSKEGDVVSIALTRMRDGQLIPPWRDIFPPAFLFVTGSRGTFVHDRTGLWIPFRPSERQVLSKVLEHFPRTQAAARALATLVAPQLDEVSAKCSRGDQGTRPTRGPSAPALRGGGASLRSPPGRAGGR